MRWKWNGKNFNYNNIEMRRGKNEMQINISNTRKKNNSEKTRI